MRVFGTENLPQEDRFPHWLAFMEQVYFDFDMKPLSPHFNGRTDVWALPTLDLASINATAIQVKRGQKQVNRSHFDGYFLLCQHRGMGLITQSGLRQRLGPGDLILVDGRRPLAFTFEGDFTQYCLNLPATRVDAFLSPRLVGQRFPTEGTLGRMMRACLQAISESPEPPAEAELPLLEDHILQLVYHMIRLQGAPHPPAPSIVAKRIHRVIQKNISNPHLNLDRVASQSGVSRRTIQKIFHGQGTTYSRYLRTLRIHHCANLMAQPAYAQCTITELALICGFGDLSGFCKAFQAVKGMSASQYRAGLGTSLLTQTRPDKDK